MPVVKTTSPVTEPLRADGLAVEPGAVLEEDVGAHTRARTPLPVDDAARGDGRQDPARAACGRRSSSSPSGSRSRPRPPPTPRRGRSAPGRRGWPTAISGVGRPISAAPALSFSTISASGRTPCTPCRPRRTRSRGPVVPIGASSNGTSFSSRACGAWSVAMQSIVPSLQALDQRLAVVLGAQRRVHLQPRVELLQQDRVGQRQVVRARLAGDPHAARLGLGDRLDRLARAQVLDVDAAVLVARRSRRRGRSASTRRCSGCRPGRAARRPRPRA